MNVGLDHRIWIYTQLKGPKCKKERYQGEKRVIETHGIATNIDLSTQAWHGVHKHIDLSIGMTLGPKRQI